MPVSLGDLAVSRDRPSVPAPRAWRTTTVLMIGLGVAILATAWLLRGHFTPATPVRVVAVVADQGPVAPTAAVLARAAGWLHPDPHPVAVSAERPGTLRTLTVRAGDLVAAGAVLATLDDRDALLTERRATAEVARAEAARERAEAEVTAAAARLAQAEDRRDRLDRAATAASAGDLAQATHEAVVRSAELAVARAAAAEAAAALDHALAARDAAALDRARCTLTAPVAGVVLRVTAVPGQHLTLEDADGARVAELFDPQRVQVRADVALTEAGRIQVGQRAEITCELLPGTTLTGRVTALGGAADPARNTLAVHIAIDDPPAALRPDMLAQVRILGTRLAETTAPAGRLLAPASGLRDGQAWIIDADGRLRRRTITVDGNGPPGWHVVTAGLLPGDQVVLEPATDLREGRRARAIPAELP